MLMECSESCDMLEPGEPLNTVDDAAISCSLELKAEAAENPVGSNSFGHSWAPRAP
jgi:hypothetical protein